jgi:3-oxoacyl-[acyl-carrier protein] reductase
MESVVVRDPAAANASPQRRQVALVTGASGGIGQAIARRLAFDGADIVVHYNSRREPAEALVSELLGTGVRGVAAQADLTQSDQVADLFELATRQFGELNIVVANAGVSSPQTPLVDVSDETFENVLSGNTRATFYVLREAARKIAYDGRIIVVGSSTTAYPAAGFGAYAASKAAALMLTPILAAELAVRQVRVNLVSAGPTDSGLLDDWSEDTKVALAAASPFGRLGTAADTADVVAFLASYEARWLSGQVLVANGAAPV